MGFPEMSEYEMSRSFCQNTLIDHFNRTLMVPCPRFSPHSPRNSFDGVFTLFLFLDAFYDSKLPIVYRLFNYRTIFIEATSTNILGIINWLVSFRLALYD